MFGHVSCPALRAATIVSLNQWLSINFSADGGMRIAVKTNNRTHYKSQINLARPKRLTKVLNLLPSSGPFFVYAEAEQHAQDQRIDQRLCEVSLNHHVKVDHA